ncbi:MAG: hypothetical protein IJQ04_01955 [Prevotella sp.]|nr:hypothetical protein [Prevotella sp.]
MRLLTDSTVADQVLQELAEYKAGQWKPYEELIPEKEPDSIRVKYDGQNFILKTSDKEVNKAIKQDVFMMEIDHQLFINQRPLRDENGGKHPAHTCEEGTH